MAKPKSDLYQGDVCYRDGWHWSVVDGEPGVRLVLDEAEGTFRVATDTDKSWHERHHGVTVTVEMT